MNPRSISGINRLPQREKEAIYTRFIPKILLERFNIPEDFTDESGNRLLEITCEPDTSDFVLRLKHKYDSRDALLYSHVTDTMNRQIHVLLYIVNDPDCRRYDVDVMPDGSPTQFGIFRRNLAAEQAAMDAGLAPGQIRCGLRSMKEAVESFEAFVSELGHDLFFAEPLHYHNAIVFEKYGFAYMKGRRLMESIHRGFSEGGPLALCLDGSSPFRQPEFINSIRGRSWAIHDGILGHAYTEVTMYKSIGKVADINTFPGAAW